MSSLPNKARGTSISLNSATISIVITCFNYTQYVGLAIESAIRQTYMHKEMIAVNDGSTDNSLEVITRS